MVFRADVVAPEEAGEFAGGPQSAGDGFSGADQEYGGQGDIGIPDCGGVFLFCRGGGGRSDSSGGDEVCGLMVSYDCIDEGEEGGEADDDCIEGGEIGVSVWQGGIALAGGGAGGTAGAAFGESGDRAAVAGGKKRRGAL